MKKTIVSLILMVGLVLCASSAIAAGKSKAGGLVVDVRGGITLSGAQNPGKQIPVVKFMQVLPGDVITLKEGSNLRVVFPGSGRDECWSGPTKLGIENDEGICKDNASSCRHEVKNLPPGVTKQLGMAVGMAGDNSRMGGNVVMRTDQRLGGTIVRGGGTKDRAPLKFSEDDMNALNLEIKSARESGANPEYMDELKALLEK